MGSIFQKLLGINWKTTLAGITVMIAAVSRIALAYKARDFQAIFTDGQLIFETVGMLLAGVGLLRAKDANVTGVGEKAKTVDTEGTLTNTDGKVVGQQ